LCTGHNLTYTLPFTGYGDTNVLMLPGLDEPPSGHAGQVLSLSRDIMIVDHTFLMMRKLSTLVLTSFAA
jgi:hypothetical protein